MRIFSAAAGSNSGGFYGRPRCLNCLLLRSAAAQLASLYLHADGILLMVRRAGLKCKRSLRYAGLHVSTLRAYKRAVSSFLAYANKSAVTFMLSSQLDRCVSGYLDECFQEGEPLSYAVHLLSTLKRFHPHLKFKLPEASQFYKNWTKTYHSVRAIPASWELTEELIPRP